MKKNVISLVLALVMTVSLCVMPAIADNSNAKPYKVYTAIGDSIPAGYGPYNYLIKGYDRIPNTYPVYVADAVAEEYIPLARTGFRTVELRYMLEEDFEGDPPMLFSMGRMYEEEIALRKPTYEPSIVRSDLITLNVGTNDILSYAFYYAKDKLSNDPTYKKITDALNAMLGETDDIGLLFNEMFSMANSLGYYAEYFAAFAEGIYVGFNGLKENWDSIVGDIYALNPDVELLVIGIYNPLKTTSLTSYDIYPLGKAFQIIVDLANQYLKNTSKYCRQYTFVDVKDTEIYELGAFSDANYQKQMMGLTHPTKNGHQYMANQILKTLNLPANAGENDISGHGDPKYLNNTDHKAYVSGYSDGTFRPQQSATRSEVASMLYGLLDNQYKTGSSSGFKDISGHWAEVQISGVAAAGIMQGYSDGTFRPNTSITRAEVATIIAYLFDENPKGSAPFSDIDGHWAAKYISKAYQLGLIAGFADGTFKPDQKVTRGQLVAMINEAMNRHVELTSITINLEDSITFSDITAKDWYYGDIMEAANTHDFRMNKDYEVWTSVHNS